MAGGPGGKSVGKVSVRVVPDTSRFREELKAQLEAIEKKSKIKIPVELESTALEKQMAKIRSSSLGDFKVHADLDDSEFARKVKISGKKALTELDGVALRMSRIGSRISDAFTNNGRSGFQKLVRAGSTLVDTAQRVGSAFADALSKVATSALSAATSVGQVAAVIALVGAVAGLVAPALGLIATLLAGIPFLIAAVALPVAAIALGFDGIKKAASSLKKPFEKLQKTLDKTFEVGLKPIFKAIGTLMPLLTGGLNLVAGGVINLARAITDVFTSAKGVQQLDTIFRGVAKLFDAIVPGVKDIIRIFLTLGEIGAQSIKPLADAFNEFFSGFRGTIDKLKLDGSFKKAFEALAKVMGTVSTAFDRIFEAGVRIMPSIATPLNSIIMAITDFITQNMPLIAGLFDGLATFITTLLPGLTGLFGEFTPEKAQAIKDFATTAANFILTIVQAIIDIVDWTKAAIQNIKDFIQGVKDVWTAIMDFFTGIGQWFADLWTNIQTIWNNIVEWIKTRIQDVKDFFTNLGPNIKAIWDKIWEALKEAVKTKFNEIKQAISDKIEEVLQAIREFPGKVVQAIGDLGRLLFQKGVQLVQGLIDGIKNKIGDLVRAAGELASKLNPFSLMGPMADLEMGGIAPPTVGTPDVSGAMQALTGLQGTMQALSGGMDMGIPAAAMAGIDKGMSSAKVSASSQFDAHVSSDGFGDLGEKIAAAMADWSIQFDQDGVARMVNKANNRRARR